MGLRNFREEGGGGGGWLRNVQEVEIFPSFWEGGQKLFNDFFRVGVDYFFREGLSFSLSG